MSMLLRTLFDVTIFKQGLILSVDLHSVFAMTRSDTVSPGSWQDGKLLLLRLSVPDLLLRFGSASRSHRLLVDKEVRAPRGD